MHRCLPPFGIEPILRRLVVQPLLFAGLLAGFARPAAASKPYAKLLKAIEADNFREAKRLLEDIDYELESATTEVSAVSVSNRYQAEARYNQIRGRDADALKALRQACLVHPSGEPNLEILGEGPLVDTFYAVCTEVQQRPEVDLGALSLPNAPIRIDGRAPGGDFPILEGRHLLQIQCADATWTTQWSSLEYASEWAEGCPGGAVATAEAERSDDPMDMVPFFGDDAGEEEDLGDEGSAGTAAAVPKAAATSDSSGDATTDEPAVAAATEDDNEVQEAGATDNPAAAALPDQGDEASEGAAAEEAKDTDEAPAEEEANDADATQATGASESSAEAMPADTAGERVYMLDLRCTPGPCTIKVDGAEAGSTDLEVMVSIGEHKIELSAGEQSIERILSLDAKHSATLLTWNHQQNSVEMEHRYKD